MMFCKLCGMAALVASASALLPHSSTVRAVRAGPTAVMMSASSEATQQLRARVRGLLDEVPTKLADGASMPPSTARLEAAYAADSHEDMYVNFLEFFMDLKIDYDVSEEDEMLRPTVHACTDVDDFETQEKLIPLYLTAMSMLEDSEPNVQFKIWGLVVDKLAGRVGLSNQVFGDWIEKTVKGS